MRPLKHSSQLSEAQDFEVVLVGGAPRDGSEVEQDHTDAGQDAEDHSGRHYMACTGQWSWVSP